MLKYVADKIDSSNGTTCQCFHYMRNEKGRELQKLGKADDWYRTEEHAYRNETIRFGVQIRNVHLYCFSTGVGILAFEIGMKENDPLYISNCLYYLKKVSRESLYGETNPSSFTLLDCAKEILCKTKSLENAVCFYYAIPSTERANALIYLEVDAKEDYKRELFYLWHCYSDGFLYTENSDTDKDEIYIPSRDTVCKHKANTRGRFYCVDSRTQGDGSSVLTE